MKSNRLLSSPENPSKFLIMIPSDDTESTGIEIPEKFREKHGKDLLEKVILKVPNGDIWQVDLEKSNDNIWLKNGWGEFAKHYGINFAYLIVFKYEGFSMFNVIILSPSASEIVYPNNAIQDDATKASASCDKEVEIIELEDDTCSSGNEDASGNEDSLDNENASDNEDASDSEDEDYDEGEHSKKRQKMIEEVARRAIEKADADFKCDKPYLMVYMHRSYFTKRGMVVPTECRRKLLRGNNSCSWSLQVEKDGKRKTWDVVASNANLGDVDWMMFLEDNGIRVGDIIAFELINMHNNVLGVTVIRSDC